MEDVFDALSDPNRRWLLQELSQGGPCSATKLAAEMSISRQAVVKHLAVMTGAGLLRPKRDGREVLYEVLTDRLDDAASWLTEVGRLWDRRLERLGAQLGRRQT